MQNDKHSIESYNSAIHNVENCSHNKHNHAHDESCSCGNKHHKGDENCSCGGRHHEHHEHCSCGGKHEQHEENIGCSCCGIDMGEDHSSCCGVDLSAPKKGKISKYWIYLIISLPILVASFLLSYLEIYNPVPFTAVFDPAWIVIVLCGLPIYRGAIKNLKRKKITAALLISIAMTASIVMGVLLAFGIGDGHSHESYIFAAGEIAFLMTLGQQIEGVTSRKSRSAVKTLIDMTPVLATLKTNDGYVDVSAQDVEIGDILLCRPNEVIALDGIVSNGYGSIDTSSITGEYAPLDVKQGDKVYAGTKNLGTAFEIQATSKSSETTLSKLITYVKEAEKKKAPFVQLADKWASYIVPTTCALSVIVLLLSLFAFKAPILESIQRAITVLIVVCPCAMTLATPIAVAAGIGNAGKKGALIKSGVAFEALSKIKVVCFDKTGTLTEGKLKVESILPYEIEREDLLRFTASLESKSEHLIGKAIVEEFNGVLMDVENVVSNVGVGIKGEINGQLIEVIKLDDVLSLIPSSHRDILENSPTTTVAVLIDSKYKGAILVSDTIKDSAPIAIKELNDLGIKTSMLTGDNRLSASAVASAIGIDEAHAGLLPEDKVSTLETYKANGEKVLMVGDGVNDAPAMGAADTSLAMGAMGNSVAIETADISLLTGDLKKISFLIKLSRVAFRLVKVNIIISLCISLTAVVLSSLGLLNAVSGALLHNASSVYVCLSASMLLLYKGKNRT